MPMIMSLEGPRLGHVQRRGYTAQPMLGGVVDMVTAHPIIILLALVGGAYFQTRKGKRGGLSGYRRRRGR